MIRVLAQPAFFVRGCVFRQNFDNLLALVVIQLGNRLNSRDALHFRQRGKRRLDLRLHLLQQLPPVGIHEFPLDAPVVEIGVRYVNDDIFDRGRGCS